jgi:hypothetical protein
MKYCFAHPDFGFDSDFRFRNSGFGSVILCLVLSLAIPAGAQTTRPVIRKLGTRDFSLVETTPFVFKDHLYRFDWVRPDYAGNTEGSHYRIIDPTSQKTLSSFAPGHAFGCAFVEGDTVWVFGVEKPGGDKISAFWSADLKKWERVSAMELAGWTLFNTSACKCPDGYLMAVEVGSPPQIVGTGFTTRFLKSKDLRKWELIPEPAVYTKDRYSACPTIRYVDGIYYMLYLEQMQGWSFQTYIARSRDLIRWELSPRNPVLRADVGDKKMANGSFTAEEQKTIASAEDINNSDIDFVEFGGKVMIYYSWGNQKGIEFLRRRCTRVV